jgi:hypothetical protein
MTIKLVMMAAIYCVFLIAPRIVAEPKAGRIDPR